MLLLLIFFSLEVVGHGASSYVRKALHKKSQTVMALKVCFPLDILPFSVIQVINVFDQDKRKQLMTEVQTLFNCECPQLVSEPFLSFSFDFGGSRSRFTGPSLMVFASPSSRLKCMYSCRRVYLDCSRVCNSRLADRPCASLRVCR